MKTLRFGSLTTTLAAAALVAASASGALAAGSAGGRINEIVTYAAGTALINVDGWYDQAPACNIFVPYGYKRFLVDLSTPGGKALYGSLSVAMQTKSTILLSGTGDCRDGAELLVGIMAWPSP